MNITDTEYTTKADVVVDIENPDKKPEEKNGDILKEHIDSVEVQREEQVTLDENPLDVIENSVQKNEALIADTNQSLPKEENPLVVPVDPNHTTTLQVLEPATSTTPATKREESDAHSSLVENILETILDPTNTSVILSDLVNTRNAEEDINNNQSNKNTTKKENTSEDKSSGQEISNLDLLTVKYTTIFLRLFAPESTTTAEPKLGYVQQEELPEDEQRPDDNALQQNPVLLNPQTFDVGHKVNTTSSTSVTPSIPTKSLSTKYTTTTTAPVVFSSASPKPQLELDSTNGKETNIYYCQMQLQSNDENLEIVNRVPSNGSLVSWCTKLVAQMGCQFLTKFLVRWAADY